MPNSPPQTTPSSGCCAAQRPRPVSPVSGRLRPTHSWTTARDDVSGEADGEQYDREARAGLRRVGGLSTELEDVTEVEYRQLRLENVVLIGVYSQGSQEEAENSMRELAALAETAGRARARRRAAAPPAPRPQHVPRPRQGRGAARTSSRRSVPTRSSPTPSSRPASGVRSKTRSRSRSSTAPPSSSTSSASTPRAARARRRSNSRSSSTCCPASAAGVSRCPARPVARSVAPAPEWVAWSR